MNEQAKDNPEQPAEDSPEDRPLAESRLPEIPPEPAQIEDTENYIEACHAVAEWIRFADAKAGVVLTVGGALAGLLIPTISPIINATPEEHLFPFWKPVVLSLFALFTLFLLLAGVAAFRCITPFRRRGRHPALEHCSHFHPAAVAASYRIDQVKDFLRDCDEGGVAQFRREVIAALLFDAHISNVKYYRVTLVRKCESTPSERRGLGGWGFWRARRWRRGTWDGRSSPGHVGRRCGYSPNSRATGDLHPPGSVEPVSGPPSRRPRSSRGLSRLVRPVAGRFDQAERRLARVRVVPG